MELGGFSPTNFALRSPVAPPAGGKALASTSGGQGGSGADAQGQKPSQPGATSATGEPLTTEQQNQVRDLKKRDQEVRAHEQAHAAVGGSYASAPKYTYTQGPDGKKYAVGGEVQIDTSPERTPEATVRKMDVVIAAALAPAEPSSQDQAVARQAQQQRAQAQTELQDQRAAERKGRSAGTDEDGDSALPSDLFAQIVSQSSGVSSTGATAAANAYSSAASLAGQIFGAY